MRLICNGKKVENATWEDVEAVLPELKEEACFQLAIRPYPESGPEDLDIRSESGNYMPIMGYVEGGGESFSDLSAWGQPPVEIGGADYSAVGITRDFDLIVRMIKEFYDTGTVSPELWKPQDKED